MHNQITPDHFNRINAAFESLRELKTKLDVFGRLRMLDEPIVDPVRGELTRYPQVDTKERDELAALADRAADEFVRAFPGTERKLPEILTRLHFELLLFGERWTEHTFRILRELRGMLYEDSLWLWRQRKALAPVAIAEASASVRMLDRRPDSVVKPAPHEPASPVVTNRAPTPEIEDFRGIKRAILDYLRECADPLTYQVGDEIADELRRRVRHGEVDIDGDITAERVRAEINRINKITRRIENKRGFGYYLIDMAA